MRIIPVIDLKAGLVVRAIRGDRRNYEPWRSPICPNADPLEAFAGFLRLYPFRTFYVADLDAIEGRKPHHEILRLMNSRYPDLRLWLDSGLTAKAAATWEKQPWLSHVLGTESMSDEDMRGLEGHILSLDFKGGQLIGPANLLTNTALWPETVIVMTLDDVGAKNGPNTQMLAAMRAKSASTQIYAAGGIRNAADLTDLKTLGINGALIATALHEGHIDAAQLNALALQ